MRLSSALDHGPNGPQEEKPLGKILDNFPYTEWKAIGVVSNVTFVAIRIGCKNFNYFGNYLNYANNT